MLPSVRGRERTAVAAVLIGSGTASGALVGLVVALLLAAALSPVDLLASADRAGLALIAVAIGAVLDGARLVTGRPSPPTAGRQVPREWAWIFPPTVTAGLFGARLGVGPLTILSTWTWWSFTIAAGLLGPAAGALAGATFGLVRLIVTAWVSIGVHPTGHPAVFGCLRAGQRRGWATITVLTSLLALVTAGCASSDGLASQAVPTTAQSQARAATGDETAPPATDALIAPAELEDVVRTSTPTEAPTDRSGERRIPATAADPPPGAALSVEPVTAEELAATLVGAIPGYEPIDDPAADRALDLSAAAGLQPDPTEEIALLETRGFGAGWTRAFRSATNDVAVVSVYRFRDAAEAEFYLEDGLITIGGYGGTFFDIPDLPGVRGFAQTVGTPGGDAGEGEELVSLGASFNQGNRWYLLYLLGSPESVTPEVLVPAVAAQHRMAGS